MTGTYRSCLLVSFLPALLDLLQLLLFLAGVTERRLTLFNLLLPSRLSGHLSYCHLGRFSLGLDCKRNVLRPDVRQKRFADGANYANAIPCKGRLWSIYQSFLEWMTRLHTKCLQGFKQRQIVKTRYLESLGPSF